MNPGPRASPGVAITFFKGGRVVTPVGVLDDAWLQVEEGRISQIGGGAAPQGRSTWAESGSAWLHRPSRARGRRSRRSGVGGRYGGRGRLSPPARHYSYVVSLNAAPPDALAQELQWVAQMVAEGDNGDGHIIGAHLEGPFLSEVRRGAQNPAHLLMPDRKMFARLVEAACGTLRTVTIAPELPGALDVIGDALAAGAVVAIGHTDATSPKPAQPLMPVPAWPPTSSTGCGPCTTASQGRWDRPSVRSGLRSHK